MSGATVFGTVEPPSMWRALRHSTVAWVTAAATRAAPHTSPQATDRLARLVAIGGPWCPIVAANVAANMRALGVYSGAAHRAYFQQLGVHFAGALHALRCGDRGDAGQRELTRIARQQIELDESVERLCRAAAAGRGAILMGPHIANYLLNLTRLNEETPLTVYLRHSKHARRQAAKQRWYQASGVAWISEPADQRRPLGRLSRMAEALDAGRVLFITPDLPQRRDAGTAVRFFDREIYLPAGAALLAARTGAPLFMLTARASGARQRLVVHGPVESRPANRGRDERRATVERHMQWFATGFEQFVIEQTPLWYLWGDKRWTQVLRGDPPYARRLETRAIDADAQEAARRAT